MSLWSLLLCTWALLATVQGQQGPIYMDQPSGCGQKLRLSRTPVYVHGRSEVAPPFAPTSCVVHLETDSTDSKYRLELTIKNINIQDCGIKLEIFDHSEAYGQHLRSLGCGTKSTDTMYSSGRYITLKLSRPVQLYQPGYDFTLEIRAFSNEDETGGGQRVNRIGEEVIIPLILGVLLLIFIGVILCCCYRQGRLPGMHGRQPRKHAPHNGSTANIIHVSGEKKVNGGIDNPIISVTPNESRKVSKERNGFNLQNPIVWSTLAAGESDRDPATGRQRGRSAIGSQSRLVPIPPPLPPVSTSTPTDRSQGQLVRGEVQRSSAASLSSDPSGRRMYRKNNEPFQNESISTEGGRGKIDSYLENKGVKIAMYPDDSLKRKGVISGDQSPSRKRGSYAEDQARKRGSYAEDEARTRDSIAGEKASQRGSYTEAGPGDRDTGRSRSRKGTSPNRGTGTSPSKKGTSPSRPGSSSPGRRRSPGEKRRSRDGEARSAGNHDAPPEGDLKRPASGFFENPDDEGYIYSYDHLYPEGEMEVQSPEDKGKVRPRSGSAAEEFEEDEDGYLLVHNDKKSKPQRQDSDKRSKLTNESGKPGTRSSTTDGTSYETIELNPQGSNKKNSRDPNSGLARKGSKRRSMTEEPEASTGTHKSPTKNRDKGRRASGEFDDRDELQNSRYPIDQQSEPNEAETISNPLHSNPAVRSKIDAEDPPGGKKRRKGNGKPHHGERDDDTVSESGSVRYAIPPSALPGNQDPRSRLDSYPYTVGPSAALQTIVSRTTDPMAPPEQRFVAAFQNQTPSTHNSPSHVAGKAAWYVQTTPSNKGPVTHGAFMMQTRSSQPSREQLQNQSGFRPYEGRGGRFPDQIPSHEDSYHASPPRRGYHPTSASTPHSSNRGRPPTGGHQHFSPIEKADQTPGQSYQSSPDRGYDRYPAHNPDESYSYPSNPNMQSDPRYTSFPQKQLQPRYVDPGTSIFDEPGHRAAVMRSGIDPNTGNEVNQVVWTDTIPDATDPPGPNPDVTRKTITRITTRAGHGDIPEPDSMNSQLSFQTYSNRLTGPQPNDPAFLSPSTAVYQHGGQPPVPEPAYAQEYPEGDNVTFYLGLQGQARHPGVPVSRVHRAPSRNEAFRDKISLPSDSYA